MLLALVAGSAMLLAPAAACAADEDAAAVIRRIVDAATHPDLRWPRFPDYERHVRRLYERTDFRPLWSRDGVPTAQAAEIIEAFFAADARGLHASDYDAERLRAERARLAGGRGSPDDLGRFDAAVTICVMRYISDSYIGRINPHTVGFGLDVEPKKLDLPDVATDLAGSAAPAARLAALDPPFAIFARLRDALARFEQLAARTDLPPAPVLPTLHPGETDPGVPALRAWLAVLGDLRADAAPAADPNLYDPALADAVRRFQERHGRGADGIVGPATRRDLAVPPAARAAQIELAMERLRWLPASFSGRAVLVNVPEFRLRGFVAGEPGARIAMNVVVGSAARRTETPIMHADLRYVVFRPYWDVPSSIATREILPKAARDPGYLERHNIERVGGRIRQRPGPANALGLVKFIFPNDFHVYLHDTPSKGLFAQSRRDFSHGCIRVADPPALAEFVLGWDRARVEEAMIRGRDDQRVNLAAPIPVYLFYTTIVVDEDGRAFFFDDIYGHDTTLARVLAGGYPYPP
jgi:murein L,D-transpeptidase YcbB/YkuD